jgi:hypothetical protein
MVVTELGGEWRFASAVSKRMSHLGALTKGDRRAAMGTDLHKFDIDSIYGRRALSMTFNALSTKPVKPPCRNSNNILDKFITTMNDKSVRTDEERRVFALSEASKALLQLEVGDVSNVVSLITSKCVHAINDLLKLLLLCNYAIIQKSFLNRLAGLDVARQNLVFSLFMATLDDVIAASKATGEFEGSVEEIRASRVTLKGIPEVIAHDTSCGAVTTFTRLVVDRGISFDNIVQAIIHSDESGWLNKSKSDGTMSDQDEKLCKSGFYTSRRMIAGRQLILFAQRKFSKDVGEDAGFFDPLNLMIISRPNTGKNPCEMASHELRNKYKLLLSSDDVFCAINNIGNGKGTKNQDNVEEKYDKKNGEEASNNATSIHQHSADATILIRSNWGSVADLWDDAYTNSYFNFHNGGLAPRLSEIGLVTGAVLHILPTLEKAVQFMPLNQRSLRVMRAELTDSGRRIVGIKFPVTEAAVARLMLGMQEVATVRKETLGSPSFVDEPYPPINKKSAAWATTERNTMKSFFDIAEPMTGRNTSNISGTKRSIDLQPLQSKNGKKQKDTFVPSQAKKTSKISSFFK